MIRSLACMATLGSMLYGASAEDEHDHADAHNDAVMGGEQSATIEGTVIETMDAGRYTYVRVRAGDGEIWAAGPNVAVAVGDRVRLPPGMPMREFKSPTLGREFDMVLFVTEIRMLDADGNAASAPAMDDPHGTLPPGHPQIGSFAPASNGEGEETADGMLIGKVTEVLAAGRYTYLAVTGSQGPAWLAVPETAVSVGQTIRYPAGMKMTDFESPSLGRKFAEIYFVNAVFVQAGE
jgi:hypothetical protein